MLMGHKIDRQLKSPSLESKFGFYNTYDKPNHAKQPNDEDIKSDLLCSPIKGKPLNHKKRLLALDPFGAAITYDPPAVDTLQNKKHTP